MGKHMAGKLRPLDVERETRAGKYFDGDGLYLVVKGATSRNWIYRYRKDGKERWLGLGSLKDVSLKNARMARDAARLRVKGDRGAPGIDVVQEKRDAREKAKAVDIKVTLPTFEQCAEIYIREHWSTWSKKHRDQWPSSLKRYAYPTLGKLTGKPVDARAFGTAATVALAVAAGIDVVRVHDVAAMRDVVAVADAIVRGWRPADWGK